MKNTKKLVVSAILVSWIIVLGMTQLGFIPVGPIKATTLHIPVLIAAIIFDKKMGIILGLVFGGYSLFQNLTRPTPLSFVFLNPLVSVLPRILLPIIAYRLLQLFKDDKNIKTHTIVVGSISLVAIIYSAIKAYSTNKTGFIICIAMAIVLLIYLLMSIKTDSKSMPAFLSATIATMCHTIMVMGMIYILYLNRYAQALKITTEEVLPLIVGVVILNGVPESIIAGLGLGLLYRRKDDFNN